MPYDVFLHRKAMMVECRQRRVLRPPLKNYVPFGVNVRSAGLVVDG